jgi:hypothetical protein
MRDAVIYAGRHHLRTESHLRQIRHCERSEAIQRDSRSRNQIGAARLDCFVRFAPRNDARFIRPGSRTQVMNYAGRRHLCRAASSMRGGVIYAGRRHLCGAAPSMRGGAIHAGRRHLCGAAPSTRGGVIYAGQRHLCGAAPSIRGGVIYAGQRHLWRDSPMGPPGGSVALSRPRPAPRHAICVIASRPSEPSNERNHCRHPASASGRNHNAG